MGEWTAERVKGQVRTRALFVSTTSPLTSTSSRMQCALSAALAGAAARVMWDAKRHLLHIEHDVELADALKVGVKCFNLVDSARDWGALPERVGGKGPHDEVDELED